MNIDIDEAQVQAVLEAQTTAGIKHAFEGYAIRSAIEKAIGETVIPSIIATAIEQAASSIDIAVLTQRLAEEMARSITKGVQRIMRETMVNIILDLKKIPEYERDKREAERQKLLSQF